MVGNMHIKLDVVLTKFSEIACWLKVQLMKLEIEAMIAKRTKLEALQMNSYRYVILTPALPLLTELRHWQDKEGVLVMQKT